MIMRVIGIIFGSVFGFVIRVMLVLHSELGRFSPFYFFFFFFFFLREGRGKGQRERERKNFKQVPRPAQSPTRGSILRP